MPTITMADLLTVDRVIPRLRARNKYQALRKLIRCVAKTPRLRKDAIAAAVRDCIDFPAFGSGGNGVALLHAIVPGTGRPVAAFARLDPALNFGVTSAGSTDLVLLLVSPAENLGAHLRALACAARRLRDREVRKHLRLADGADAMFVVLTGDDWRATASLTADFPPRRPRSYIGIA
jgi:PTS system nitrogen regulatory IIA component